MVMQSAAGYYIGRACVETNVDSSDFMDGFEEPYSRESGYYSTEEAATEALGEGFPVRDCIENNYAYSTGALSLKAE